MLEGREATEEAVAAAVAPPPSRARIAKIDERRSRRRSRCTERDCLAKEAAAAEEKEGGAVTDVFLCLDASLLELVAAPPVL